MKASQLLTVSLGLALCLLSVSPTAAYIGGNTGPRRSAVGPSPMERALADSQREAGALETKAVDLQARLKSLQSLSPKATHVGAACSRSRTGWLSASCRQAAALAKAAAAERAALERDLAKNEAAQAALEDKVAYLRKWQAAQPSLPRAMWNLVSGRVPDYPAPPALRAEAAGPPDAPAPSTPMSFYHRLMGSRASAEPPAREPAPQSPLRWGAASARVPREPTVPREPGVPAPEAVGSSQASVLGRVKNWAPSDDTIDAMLASSA